MVVVGSSASLLLLSLATTTSCNSSYLQQAGPCTCFRPSGLVEAAASKLNNNNNVNNGRRRRRIMTNMFTVSKRSTGLSIRAMVGRVDKKRGTVIPEPDYRIPLVLLGIAGTLVYEDNLLVAAPVGLLGLLLLFQTTRVRFVFAEEALVVKVGNELDESGENVFVGGKNRWKYSTFINWELWWPKFPILVYFKERQTKPEGQVHFFPVIFNGKQLYDVMVERAGPSKTSAPEKS